MTTLILKKRVQVLKKRVQVFEDNAKALEIVPGLSKGLLGSLLLAAVLLVLVLSPTVLMAAEGSVDGPPIGVLLETISAKKTEARNWSSKQAIIFESAEDHFKLGSGRVQLRFEGNRVFFGEHLVTAPLDFRFRAAAGETLEHADKNYEGWVEVLFQQNRWRIVNRLPLERYLIGVIPNEMPLDFGKEALKAQAVAARTYALFKIATMGATARIHLFSDTRSQMYGGANSSSAVLNAVRSTRGQVLLDHGKVFESYFHSTCGGATRGGQHAFGGPKIGALSTVPCNYCGASKNYRWAEKIPARKVFEAVNRESKRYKIKLGAIRKITAVEPEPGGHAKYFLIEHDHGSFEIDATRFRLRLIGLKQPLLSSSFTCEREGNFFLFQGKGFGHGVGLCQYGARGLAKNGSDHVQILHYYYGGSGALTVSMMW